MPNTSEVFDENAQAISGGEEQNLSISADLIRGHINTIILRCLYDEDMYGYDIINKIEKKSGNMYTLKQPTLYSALKRLESLRYVESYYGEFSNGGRRKYFRLTDEGRRVAEKNLNEWEYSRTIIDSLISDGEAHFDFSFITEKQTELNDLKRSLQAREEALEEEKKALALLRAELQRERSLLAAQSSSLTDQKLDFNELKEKINLQREELVAKEQALAAKQAELDKKEEELAQKQAELAQIKAQLDAQTAQIAALERALSEARADQQNKSEELAELGASLLALQKERRSLQDELAIAKQGAERKVDASRLEQLLATIAEKEKEADLLNNEITALTQTIAAHEDTITALRRSLDERNTNFYNKTIELQAKEAEILNQTNELQAKQQNLEKQLANLENLKAELEEREAALLQREAELNELIKKNQSTTATVSASLSSIEERENQLAEATLTLEREKDALLSEQANLQELRAALQERQAQLDQRETEMQRREAAVAERERTLQSIYDQTDANNEQISLQREELSARHLAYLQESAQLKNEYELLRQQQQELEARQALYNEQQLDFITRKNALLAKEYEYADKMGEYEANVNRLQENIARFEVERTAFYEERRNLDEERVALDKIKIAFEEEKYAFEREKETFSVTQAEAEQKIKFESERILARQAELDALAHDLQTREAQLAERERALHEATLELNARRNERYVQEELPSDTPQEPAPYTAPTMTDLVERANAERIRLNTSGSFVMPASYTAAAANTPAAPTATYNKGLTLFKTALLTFCIILAESLVVFFLKDQLHIAPWYAAIPFGIGFTIFAVCAILYASGYKAQAVKKKKPTYFSNAFVAFVIATIIVTMVAVYLKADLTVLSALFSYVLIPIIFLANILLFALFYHWFSQAKQTKK